MGKAISAAIVVACMGLVWLLGFAFLGLMMSGDGTRHHLPVFGLYFLAGVACAITFAKKAALASVQPGASAPAAVVKNSLVGAASIVAIAAVAVGLGIAVN